MEAAILFNRSLPNTAHAVTNRDRLESALARPMHTFDGRLLFPTLIERAAALLHGVATAHGFFDGNKRTAWLCTTTYLEREGSALQQIPDLQVADFVVDVVVGRVNQEAAALWLLDRS
ncbi:type II toxin-antitoxin system death-on-curing family toxin [Mycobacteroides abscessus]|uniref:type II toxin-antitoxin system death-on-curing family toxin n=1 Tax=Mycobacteroides abscessus TaxID=36809 RepID=UPI0009416C79|nr:type II toxin-antitoxin system death-on-curing family toxin [Mycobacteroides abscessus]